MNQFGGFVTSVAIAGMAATIAPAAAQTPADSAKKAGADTAAAAPAAVAAPAGLKVNVSGFVTASYTYSSRKTTPIVGRIYDRFHDQFELNAAKVVLEKSVATDKWGAGARVDLLFGQNAAPIKSAGLDLGSHGDMTQAYATVNIPAGDGKYVQFKAGKFVTFMGVEVIEDVVNPNLSEGNQFIYVENFTMTGLRLDAKPDPKVDFELALINGWDVVEDNNTKKSFMGRLGLTPTDKTAIGLVGYFGNEKPTGGTGTRWGGNVVISQKVGPKATVLLQADYGEEKDLPAPGLKAKWWGAGVWATYDVSPILTVALRGDYVDDKDGVRTSGVLGFPANTGQKFGSGTLTLNIKKWESALIRPEIRYDRSNLTAFQASDGSGHKDQLTFALGVSYLF